jgi:hypothetical protein
MTKAGGGAKQTGFVGELVIKCTWILSRLDDSHEVIGELLTLDLCSCVPKLYAGLN